MNSFRKLLVWQKAHDLALRADKLAARIAPKKPKLAKQLSEAADSVPSCIAEGRGRATDDDFAHYVTMAIGSVTEVENHLQRGYDGGLIPFAEYESLTEAAIEVRKMSVGLRKALKGAPRKPRRDDEAAAS
jgi:four helix bundle protein